jgi:hypothetical protein
MALYDNFNYEREVLRGQSTPEGRAFTAYFRALKMALRSRDPAVVAELAEANAALARTKELGPNDVHVDATLADLSVRFQNDEYIGERIMPVATVPFRSNIYFGYDERDQLGFPDDKLGPRGQANEVSQALTKKNYSADDYGLEGFVDLTTMANADAPLDPLADETILVNEGLAFNRELRIQAVMCNPANFAGNTTAISAGSEWNSAGGGKPIELLQKAVDAVYSGLGPSRLVGFCNVNVFRTLSRHPAIRELFKFEKEGFATRDQMAKYFELDDLLVGRARKDVANKGQPANIQRMWPDVFGVVRVTEMPSIKCYTFGVTFRQGPVETIQLFKRELGKSGAYLVKSTVTEDHSIVAPKAGYLLTGCFDPTLI